MPQKPLSFAHTLEHSPAGVLAPAGVTYIRRIDFRKEYMMGPKPSAEFGKWRQSIVRKQGQRGKASNWDAERREPLRELDKDDDDGSGSRGK